MLLDFSISNFYSFDDRQQMNMSAFSSGAIRQKENTLYQYRENRRVKKVMNAVAVYGANASGKSNLLKGLQCLKRVIKESDTYISKEDYAYLMPFKFSDRKNPLFFEVSFIQNGDLFKYSISFSAEDFSIESEKILKSEIRKETVLAEKMVIERKNDAFVHYDKELNGLISEYKTQNFEYKSFLSIFSKSINKDYFKKEINTRSFKDIQTVNDFLTKKITLLNDEIDEEIIAGRILNDPDFKNRLLMALKELDFSITDFEIQDVTDEYLDGLKKLLLENDSGIRPDESAKNLIRNISKRRQYRVHTVHDHGADRDQLLPFSAESHGTRKFVRDLIEIADALTEGKVLLIDELERSYHPLVQQYVLNFFLEQKETTAQLIFTTHNSRFMSEVSLAKEQIWFVEKDRETLASELYSLADFADMTTNNHNWENMYMEGRLGAIPKVIL